MYRSVSTASWPTRARTASLLILRQLIMINQFSDSITTGAHKRRQGASNYGE